jgi:hypothetical protein
MNWICVTVTLLVAAPMPSALAAEEYRCWYEAAGSLGGLRLLHCRIDGGEVIVYSDGDEPDVPLWPAVGDDGDGECHYRRSQFTGWYLSEVNGTDNLLQYDPDGIRGGPRIADAWFRRCDGEPWEVDLDIELVWEVLESFEFATPDPTMAPTVGVTGLPTFIGMQPPEPYVESVTSPLTAARIDVEFRVVTVAIRWGDGEIQDVPARLFDALDGYPDGEITHTYEAKDYADLEVDYVWRVRWRANDGPWEPIADIEPTTWSVSYQVDEVVGRRTG